MPEPITRRWSADAARSAAARFARLPGREVMVAPEPTVLVVASDVVGSRMAGPGIRVVEMCRLLARQAAVTLAVDAPTDLLLEGVEVVLPTPRALAELAAAADLVICPGLLLARFPYL